MLTSQPTVDSQPTSGQTPGLAYLVSRYPAISHTFILREVLGLRALGLRIEVASINPPDRELEAMTAEELGEAQHTYCVKEHGAQGALRALRWAICTRPIALCRTLLAAAQFGRGFKRLYALTYAIEATMVGRWMERQGLRHLHVHFGNEGAAVGLLVKTLNRTGFSLTIHGPDEFDDVAGQRIAQKIAAADRVVCISQFARSQLMRLSDPVHWTKLDLCRLGIDLVRFTPAQTPRTPGPVRLLSVGRLAPAKGQLLLIQACAELLHRGLDFKLTIVGEGSQRTRLEACADDLGLRNQIHFAGALNQGEVQAELRQADVFVLPSLAEGIPVVLMEAMASGVPCISCPVNGIPELIAHEHSGLFAAPGDVASLAVQLERLIRNAGLRGELARAGRLQVQSAFNFMANLGQLARIFHQLPAVQNSGAQR